MADQIDALIKLRRGLDSERRTIIFDTGEIVYSTDTRHTFIGDGNTTGGSLVGNLNTIGTTPNSLAIQNDIYFDKTNCIVYMLSSDVGPESIINYARITPIADEVTLTYNNGKFSINSSYFNSSNTGFVHLAGDTMNGFLTLHHAPTARMHATNMGYVDDGLSALSASIDANTKTKFVHISGDTMQGPLNFDGQKIQKYIVEVISIYSNFSLNSTHNGAVLLIDSATQVTANISQDTLPVGFNAVFIQMNDGSVKIGTTGTVSVINVNDALLTRKKYAQMNFCVISPNVVWISGDIV